MSLGIMMSCFYFLSYCVFNIEIYYIVIGPICIEMHHGEEDKTLFEMSLEYI